VLNGSKCYYSRLVFRVWWRHTKFLRGLWNKIKWFKITGQAMPVNWKYDRVLGFDPRRGLGISLFTTASRTVLGPTQPPIQWVPVALFLGVKRSERVADHSPPSSAEVKGWVELYLHSNNTPSWHGAQLKHRDNFTFYLLRWEKFAQLKITRVGEEVTQPKITEEGRNKTTQNYREGQNRTKNYKN
jgi:hypothetical protein